MKRLSFAGDFAVCPHECGGISPLADFAAAAVARGSVSLTVSMPDGCAPSPSMLAVRDAFAGRLDILFATSDSPCDQIDPPFDPDVRIAALHSLRIEDRLYPINTDREALRSVLSALGGNANELVRRSCRALMPMGDARYDVVEMPDIDGWKGLLGVLWNADEHTARRCMIELADAWIAQNAVFAVRMMPISFCDGVMAQPNPSAMVLRRIGEARGRVVPTSHARSTDELGRNFDLACVQLMACGIANWHFPTQNGWEAFSLRYNCKKI